MTMPMMTPLPQQGFRRTPWKNGGGVTIDIADAYRDGAPAGSWTDMIWRFGRTAITVPAPFSDLSGYERMQLVIAGSGLVLETPDGEIDLRTPLRPVRYDGGTPIVSRLEKGPVEVVNLIADRARCAIDLVVAAHGRDIRLLAGTHVVYAPDAAVFGSCHDVTMHVEAGDALRIDAASGFTLLVQAGPAIVASIYPTATAN